MEMEKNKKTRKFWNKRYEVEVGHHNQCYFFAVLGKGISQSLAGRCLAEKLCKDKTAGIDYSF